jgi:hypothetical protein
MQAFIMEIAGNFLIAFLFIGAGLLGGSILCWLGNLFLASWGWLFGDASEYTEDGYCGKCGQSWGWHRKYISGENGGTLYPRKYWKCPEVEWVEEQAHHGVFQKVRRIKTSPPRSVFPS